MNEKDLFAILHQDKLHKKNNNNQIDKKGFFDSVEIFFNKWTDDKKIKDNNVQNFELVEIFKGEDKFYIPELQILKYGFWALKVKFVEKEFKYEEIFMGKLPILRINDNYFQKQDFIDILIKLTMYQKDSEKVFNNLYIIEQFRSTLQNSILYFMWVEPEKNYKYRDPYWLIINPIKKYKNIMNIYKIVNFLKHQGIHEKSDALQKAIEVLDKAKKIIINKNTFFSGFDENQLEFNLVDIVVYCYLKEIFQNLSDSELCEKIKSNYKELISFIQDFEEKISSPLIKNDNKVFKLILNHNKKEENEQIIIKQDISSRLFISSLFLFTFFFIYHHYRT